MLIKKLFTGIEEKEALRLIRERSLELNTMKDLDPLLEKIGNARIVMLGEASHGTHEYYTWRSHLTKRLLREKDFNFIAVEGDWPDCYKVNQYIKQEAGARSAKEVLQSFDRWPTWMWANWEIVALAEWLYEYNLDLPRNRKAGFYGLDVYSLWDSLDAILGYLEQKDPEAHGKAQEALRCFEPYKTDDGTSYAYATQLVPDLCQDEVLALLQEVQAKLPEYDPDQEHVFSAEQNALIAVNAEKYYRAMMKGGPHSWNVRDSHMEETLERLLDLHGPNSKAIIWEHNTHIGDSRATDMMDDGMYNIGELVRTKFKEDEVFLVGFGSYEGSVIAGGSWGAPMKEVDVPPARESSWEYLLHEAGAKNKLLLMDAFRDTPFNEHRIGHRAIGVVYRPQYERYGNYVPSVLPQRYDAFIYLDQTRALHPLHLAPHAHVMPDTYPFGF
ncbi:erythromycin esterase family protein [Paraflavisolibacter sp. H34]|uniref:erythromycin esterase family protein n=1 Tax=Huijunlia imazamoxiresistens TaxID=3127457 RepID=UPI003019C72F